MTTLLPQDEDACARNEVTFNCTIRGLRNLTSLILAWSSNEYIGEGVFLHFVSTDMPETNRTSLINGNVTAILTNNIMIDGVPELVSVLRVVGANQSSMITCRSETNGSSASTEFVSSGIMIIMHTYKIIQLIVQSPCNSCAHVIEVTRSPPPSMLPGELSMDKRDSNGFFQLKGYMYG